MPSSPPKRRAQQKDRRKLKRKEAQSDLPALPRAWKDPIRWINQSPALTVMPWESRWLRGVLQDGILYGALSVSRGNGKTSWAGAIAAAALVPGGPLYIEGTAVVVVAASFGQAREAYEATVEVLQPWIAAAPDDWRMLDSQRLLIEHRPSKTKLEVRGSEARTLHGIRKGRLFILDEPAQWQANMSDRIWSAVRTSLGKVAGAKVLAVGTRPAGGDHWFARLLEGGPATFSTSYHAERDDDPFLQATWAKANPSLKYLPALRQVIEVEADEARRDSSLLPGFKALRLNTGQRDHETVMLLEPETWERAELLPGGEALGGWVLGLDLGQNSSMSAASGYWWRSGYVQCCAMFAGTPDLAERGRRDHVGDLYQRMQDRGELMTTPGRVVPVHLLLQEIVHRWGLPSAVVAATGFREQELRESLKLAEWPIMPLITQGAGFPRWRRGRPPVPPRGAERRRACRRCRCC